MKYGPNSHQVEDYLGRVALVGADDWAALALALLDSTERLGAADLAIDAARSRARRNGLLADVDAAVREAGEAMDSSLEASVGLQEVPDRTVARVGPKAQDLTAAVQGVGVAALRTAAISGATLLVLRPLLDKEEFTKAWPMPIFDPRSLPDHVSVPGIGATAF